MPSGVTVNDESGPAVPAPFVAWTSFGSAGSDGEPVWLYVAEAPETFRVQPPAAAGKLYDPIPDSASLEAASTVNEPFGAPGT